jgi:hypothetical protein
MRNRTAAIALSAALIVVALTGGTVLALRAQGCASEATPTWAADYDPGVRQFGPGAQKPMMLDWSKMATPDTARASAGFAIVVPASLGGGIAFELSPSEPAVTAFLPASPLSGAFIDVDVLRSDGVVVTEEPAGNLSAQVVFDTVGARAADVRVGLSDGAMVHSDPDSVSGVRTYQLYFSDGSRLSTSRASIPFR